LVLLGQIALYDRLDFPRALAFAEESRAVAQRAGFVYLRPAQILADTLFAEGNLVGARSQLEQWLAALRHEQEGKAMIAGCLHDLGMVATRQGDFAAAHAFLDESLVLWDELGNADSVRACYLPLAMLTEAESDLERAAQLYRACLEAIKHDSWKWGTCLLGLATLANDMGEYELTARLLGAIQRVDQTVQRLFPIQWDDFYQLAGASNARLGATLFDVTCAEGRVRAFDQVADEAIAVLEAALHAPKHSLPD
jgi:tetratricopeptide (TPR) repeat protein